MTFSVVLCDPKSRKLGVAVATCNFAVGALVPFLKSGVGALATQASTNPHLGLNGLENMANGDSLNDALFSTLEQDPKINSRQLHGVDCSGNSWAWTGKDTVGWAGHITGKYFSVAGNMLVGEKVIKACVDAIESNTNFPLEEKMLIALKAGENEGGDKRGRQSAALLTVIDQPFPFCHLRVDDHKDPLSELDRLLKEFRKPYYQDFLIEIPKQSFK